jgi:hypothetical protein
MTDRTLTILGTVASALGLVISIITVIFTEYKMASLISLFVVELIVILIWTYYAKQKNRVMFPYDYEVGIDAARYVFETESKMTYESTTVIKVLPYQRLGELPFDERAKSYRMVVSHPLQNYMYQLKWVK